MWLLTREVGDIPDFICHFFLEFQLSLALFLFFVSLFLDFGVSENLVLEMRRLSWSFWCDILVGPILAVLIDSLAHPDGQVRFP